MYKLDLEKAEEPEIKLPIANLLNHRKNKGILEKHLLCFIDCANDFVCVDHNKLWKILKEMGILDLTYFLKNLYAGQEATARTVHRTTDWFKIGKGVVHQGSILSPCLFNLYAEYFM